MWKGKIIFKFGGLVLEKVLKILYLYFLCSFNKFIGKVYWFCFLLDFSGLLVIVIFGGFVSGIFEIFVLIYI